MGKRKTSAYYQKKAVQAKARENHYANRPARPRAKNTVKQRNTVTYIYRALFKFWTLVPGDTDSNDHFPFKVEVDADALAKVPASAAGIVSVGSYLGNPSLAEPAKGRLHPSKASWYSGIATPVPVTTAWNSSWTRYYDQAAGTAQSHYSMPISKVLGSFSVEDVHTTFKNIFFPGGNPSIALLGTKNGSAELQLEYISSANRMGT